jgi:thiol-disulfide isomerase/thioredoxin
MTDLRRRPHRRVLTAVTAAVILSACGGGGDSAGTPVTAPPVAGEAVPDDVQSGTAVATSTDILGAVMAAGDVIGDDIDLAAVDGQPVVAWFWAPWCTICRAEGPTVADVAATYRDEVVLIGVPGRGADADMQRFIDDTNTGSITHVADFGGGIWSDFGVFAQPAFAFISADGDVEVFVGSLGERALIERIEALTEA